MARIKSKQGRKKNKKSNQLIAEPQKIFQQALHLQQSGRITEAEKLYNNLLGSHPDNPDYLHYLGLINFQKGDEVNAELYFKKAIQHSENPVYLSNYCLLLRKQLKFEKAINLYKKAIKQNPLYAEAWFNLGLTYSDIYDYVAAEGAYKKALDCKKDYIKALYNLAIIQEVLGKEDEVKATISKILKIKPNNFDLYYTLGTAMKYFGGSMNIQKAFQYFEKALELEPESLETLVAFASLQKETNMPDAAINLYKKILDIEPNYFDIKLEYIACQIANSEIAEAEQELTKLPDNNNEDIKVMLLKGDIENIKGNFSKASEIYNKIIKTDKNNSRALLGLVNCKKITNEDLIIVDKLNGILEKKKSANIYFALGKAYNDIFNYDKAFDAYHKANTIRNKRIDYDNQKFVNKIDNIINIFNSEFISKSKATGCGSEYPVFVLGTPRSGTTLVEQILSSHKNIIGVGEQSYISQLAKFGIQKNVNESNYPERISSLSENDIKLEAEIYLENFKNYINRDIYRVVDKMPSNFMYIGYIFLLFPHAKIIHCTRNPLDACISMYFQNFESYVQYSFDLENLGHWYKEYIRLMEHWKSLYGDRILDIDYEDTVNNTEQISRKMIQYCELGWDDQCIEFYKTKRDINTASQWQVRQPIYQSSLERWKRYDKHIGILKDILEGHY